MLSVFSLRVRTCYVPVHVSTDSGVNGRRFVRKQYKLSVKSFRILNESERTMLSHLYTYPREQIVVSWEEGKTVADFGVQKELCMSPSVMLPFYLLFIFLCCFGGFQSNWSTTLAW